MLPQTWITIITAIISTGTTVFLAYITWRYVRLTREYVGLTNEILKATNKPEVILFLHDNGAVIYLCIENIGTGYASDIEFTGDLSFRPTFPRAQPLKETEPFKSGINYLGSEYKISVEICESNEIRKLPQQSFNIIVTYKDSTGAAYRKNFPFEVGSWESARQFIIPQRDP